MKKTKLTTKILTVALACVMMLSFASCDAKMNSMDAIGPEGNYAPNYPPLFDDGNVNAEKAPNYFAPKPEEDKEAGDDQVEGEPSDPSAEEPLPPVDNDIPVFAENPFVLTVEENTSTFSADVDTASYAYFRKLVNSGYQFHDLRNSGTIFRIEEFVNYFKYNVSQPEEGKLFGVNSAVYPCPWNTETKLLQVTMQAEKGVPAKGNNLVFLIDVSGSMRSEDKLPLLKKTFSYLVDNLGENDTVSIVTYSGQEALVLDGCRGNMKSQILNAMNNLQASGSTNGQAGLTMAYQIAEKHYIEGGNNRIIMASDGDLNVGISSAAELTEYISEKRDQGVYLSVLGFGTGNFKDEKMEALADNGNGVYYYIDGESEAEKVFATDLLSTLYTVAEDVKLQITFNSELIKAYRLIGYENRVMDNEDFNNDAKDAGEVGSGHQFTVLYELVPENKDTESETLATLKFRYKNPGESLSLYNEHVLNTDIVTDGKDDENVFICAVVELCMMLRNSEYGGEGSLVGILEVLDTLDLSAHPERAEFRELVRKLVK